MNNIIGVLEYKGDRPKIDYIISGISTDHIIDKRNYIAFYDSDSLERVILYLSLTDINKMRIACNDFKLHNNLPGYKPINELNNMFDNLKI